MRTTVMTAGTAATTDAPVREWSLGRRFMLRAGGLPIEAARRLRSPGSCDWADAVCQDEDRLREQGAAVSDLLHDLIGSADGDLRRRLLNIRRQVFNGQLPGDPGGALELASQIGGPAGEALSAWVRGRRLLEARRGLGPGLLDTELAAARAELRRLADEPRLRQGLLLASPSLDEYLGSYVRHEGGSLNKRQRRIERSLLEYVYRVACKTSPFSTFAGLMAGEFSAAGGAAEFSATLPAGWAHYPRLNVAVLARIAELIVSNEALRPDLPVALVSGWRREEDRIRYVRRVVTAGDTDVSVSFDAVQEDLFFLREGDALGRLSALLESGAAVRFSDLVTALNTAGDAAPGDYERFLAVLLRLGMLHVPSLKTDVHSQDPLSGFRDAVRALGTPWSADLATRLGEPVALLSRYADAGLAERRELLSQLRGQLGGIQRLLGAEDAGLPRSLLYEDSRVARPLVVAGRAPWLRAVEASLESLSRLTPVFDATLPHRLTLKGFFVLRYGSGGRCDDLLKLVHDFREDIYQPYLERDGARRAFGADGSYTPLTNWLRLPELAALDTAREEFARRMRAAWQALPPGADELVIPGELLTAVAGPLAGLDGGFRPECHFLQIARNADGPLAVLNRSYGGLAFPFSRFTHCFTDAGPGLASEVLADTRAAQPPGAVFAEVTGGFATTNLNLHGRLTDFELVCPGETSCAPAEARIPLSDLYAEHDPGADRLVLRSARLGAEVIPVYLGYLTPYALPVIAQTLLLFSDIPMARLGIWDGVPEGPADEGVTQRPRVRHGSVVVRRRTWTAEAARLPSRAAADSDAEWFLAWRRWRIRHRLPEQVFASLSRDPGGDREAGPARPPDKPRYLDFASYLSLSVFESLLAKHDHDQVVLSEMLPGPNELTVTSPAGHHVAELVVETHVRSAGGLRRRDVS